MRGCNLLFSLALALAGCGGSGVATGASTVCTSDADCATGTSCRYGVCGAFSNAPASCGTSPGAAHPYDFWNLQSLLPGCWITCSTDSPKAPFPSDWIGWGISSDVTHWWMLTDDGQGHPVPRMGFDQGGWLDVFYPGFPVKEENQIQVNMLVQNGWFGLQPLFSDGPPPHMSQGGDPSATAFVRYDGECSDPGMALPNEAGSPFGGSCDPNAVRPTSCQALDGGLRCSFCSESVCVQPCHTGGNDCASPQQCTPFGLMTEVMLSGECAGYDGYCK